MSGCLTSTPLASGSAGCRNEPRRCRPQIENPLVRVGLVPQDLANIFLTPQAEERNKLPSRSITGVRVLTSNEYVEILKEKDRKEKEASEKKQRQKEERQCKKMENEKSKRGRKQKKKGGRAEGRERVSVPSSILQVKMKKRLTVFSATRVRQ